VTATKNDIGVDAKSDAQFEPLLRAQYTAIPILIDYSGHHLLAIWIDGGGPEHEEPFASDAPTN
jgi:hypothetical protein